MAIRRRHVAEVERRQAASYWRHGARSFFAFGAFVGMKRLTLIHMLMKRADSSIIRCRPTRREIAGSTRTGCIYENAHPYCDDAYFINSACNAARQFYRNSSRCRRQSTHVCAIIFYKRSYRRYRHACPRNKEQPFSGAYLPNVERY